MPTSNLHAAPWVLHYAYEVLPDRPAKILDIGPGRGKYAVLFREYVDPEAEITAVEAWTPYIDDHGLEHLYDRVIAGDIRDQPAEVLESADITLMVDVIEHLPLEDGFDLISRIPGWIILATPREFFHNPPDLPGPEAHVSHWTLEQLQRTGRFEVYNAALYGDPERQIVARLRPRP